MIGLYFLGNKISQNKALFVDPFLLPMQKFIKGLTEFLLFLANRQDLRCYSISQNVPTHDICVLKSIKQSLNFTTGGWGWR